MSCFFKGNNYYVGLGGVPEAEGEDIGQWRIRVTKSRSIIQKLTRKNKLSDQDPILSILSYIIVKSGFSNVSTDSA
ncbi:hypothetical protein [uncultured Microbulbifer sp.]|uniref:hypothetical protein n=1 Tax=uncultured Microbulbifer sp. TaxID=348147 RepID=UPI002606664E|nr:hypothetical protein [uncultured Microbulbifer sp.]